MEILVNDTAHIRLGKVLLIELKQIFLKDQVKYFPEVMRWDRCVMVVELFVCFFPSS